MLRTPAPRAWRRLLGTTAIAVSCLVSSGFAWTSQALPLPVTKDRFRVRMQVSERTPAGTYRVVASHVFIIKKSGKFAEFVKTTDANTYALDVRVTGCQEAQCAPISGGVKAVMRISMIAVDGTRTLLANPSLVGVETRLETRPMRLQLSGGRFNIDCMVTKA